jgi:hypothetical protein
MERSRVKTSAVFLSVATLLLKTVIGSFYRFADIWGLI